MRRMFIGPATIALGSSRVWRTLALSAALGISLLSWLAIRLWTTYLPPSPPMEDVYSPGSEKIGPAAATVQCPPVDLSRLEEQVRRTAQAVLPSVVAVESPSGDPTAKGYGSGVIITADGVVLSQGHVSHRKEPGGGATSGKAGDRTNVILHDGRECPAELLGANRIYDVSLLRLLDPGPYPHVPIRATVPVAAGDWVLKIGHPLGYRKGRSAPVRLGRVTWGTAELFSTDCMLVGGDSGGPFFNLDGQLLGILFHMNGYPTQGYINDASTFQRTGGWSLFSVTGIKRIDSLLDAMLGGEVTPYDSEQRVQVDRELARSARLKPADFSQGPASLARYQSVVGPTCASVVVVMNAGVAIGLGTIVDTEGWVITKASVLPGHPACRLPDGKVVSARVAGVDPAYDLALLSVPATDLKPVRWADDFDPPVGTLLATVGTEQPLAVGVVSVPRRDLESPVRPTDTLPLRLPAGHPYIYGTAEPKSGFSLRVAFGLSREGRYRVSNVEGLAYSAGIRPDDFLYRLNGRSIVAGADIEEAVSHLWSGDVVPVRLERGGRMMDLSLPLGPDSHGDQKNYRADDFPTLIECAVPFYSYECGGPIVDITGRAIGVTIARNGPHGGVIIPGDCVRKLLPDLQSGRLAGNWTPVRPPGK
jgi:serine protease Do